MATPSSFGKLEQLRRFLQEIRDAQVESLVRYFSEPDSGFRHKLEEPKLSRASTATCVLSLVSTGNWDREPWKDSGRELLRQMMLEPFDSASLGPDNPFTTAFALETFDALENKYDFSAATREKLENRVKHAESLLIQALSNPKHKGAVQLGEGYPPSAYLTQLAVRILLKRAKLRKRIRQDARTWAFNELNRQIGLRWARDKTADIFALIYSAIVLASIRAEPNTTPDEERVLRTAIAMLFEAQREDGTWPASQPLFHYKQFGNAYCFDYEMLVQLLRTDRLQTLLLEQLDGLAKAAFALKTTEFSLGGSARGWASGHHPQLRGPESWSTASVFHFAHALDRLLAEALRQTLFRRLDQNYQKPLPPKLKFSEFAPDFVDSKIRYEGRNLSLRRALWTTFVQRLTENVSEVEQGRKLPKIARMSAIFFGPPGTSKTDLAKHVAKSLGWPLLLVDPSHLVRAGMDKIQAQANTLFGMLSVAESIVVLFDEFDEMVRDRSSPTSEANSRFLTTAMLPKLTSIHDNRRIVFILATNYIDQFDFAVTRLGRFDQRFQIMPPTAEAKLKSIKFSNLATAFLRMAADQRESLREQIAVLTYSECEDLNSKLSNDMSADAVVRCIETAARNCTLSQRPAEPRPVSSTTWLQQAREQSNYVRL